MATSHVYLQGGPCNGRTVSTSQIQGGLVGYVLCKGHYYESNGKQRPNGDEIFADSGTTAPQPPPGPGQVRAPHALNAWADLRGVMNRELPTTLRQVGGLNRATRNLLAKKHRVKG